MPPVAVDRRWKFNLVTAAVTLLGQAATIACFHILGDGDIERMNPSILAAGNLGMLLYLLFSLVLWVSILKTEKGKRPIRLNLLVTAPTLLLHLLAFVHFYITATVMAAF